MLTGFVLDDVDHAMAKEILIPTLVTQTLMNRAMTAAIWRKMCYTCSYDRLGIVPVKPLRRGKSRLAGLLSEEQRTCLNRYLLEHTLTILNKISDIEHTLVVSRDPAALALTRSMGGRTVMEDGAPQFNTALKRATIVARRREPAPSLSYLPICPWSNLLTSKLS